MNKTAYFDNPAGEKFRFREDVPEHPVAAVIGVHGVAEHMGRYDHVAAHFAGRGISFHMMENRGHGESIGKRGHIDSYGDFIEDLHLFRRDVQGRIGDRPLFMLGHSNGALISATYALKYGDGIRGLVLSGLPIRTGVKVNPLKLKLGMILGGIVPKLTLPSELDPHDICSDKKVVENYINDPLVFRVMSVGFAKEFFNAMAGLLERAPGFRHPVLFLHGSEDRPCDPAAAREFHDKISSDDKEFILYEGLYHEVFNEAGKEKILETASQWVLDRVGK